MKKLDKLLEVTKGTNTGLIVRLAYYTGMRLGVVSGLTWNYVHLGEDPFLYIPEKLSKSGEPRSIPLVGKSLHIVEQWKQKLEQKKKNPSGSV
ncbi:MAG: tyrosine-type recombinase/integrase [Fodinibius sp.]|nr:tyrosine-type recombinase/integrase [Fodinibius sp.]